MPNLRTRGRLVDTVGQPVAGAIVTVYDNDVWPFRDRLGSAVTDAGGAFVVAYPASAYGPLERQPDIKIEVTQSGDTIFVGSEIGDVQVEDLDLGTLVVTGTNVAVQGRVVNPSGQGIGGLIVTATDIDITSANDLLGSAVTDTAGRFRISYSAQTYREINDRNPDVVVTVSDSLGLRILAKTAEIGDVTTSTLDLPDIVVSNHLTAGWATTLGLLSPTQLSEGNTITIHIDNEVLFAELIQAIDSARSTVSLLELSFDPTLIATFSGGTLPSNATAPERVLANALLSADARGVTVRILVSTFLTENPISRSFGKLRDFFRSRMPNGVRLRGINLQQPVHAKALLIDEDNPQQARGFILGSPLEQGYWDTTFHLHDDPRRGEGATGIERPIHEVSLAMRGPALADVSNLFRQLWNHLSDTDFRGADKLTVPAPIPARTGRQAIQVNRSIPRSTVMPSGEAGILEAYLRAMANATDFLYLENQYFSSRVFIDTLTRVLRSKPSLQVIALINEHPDIPTYRSWQNQRITTLMQASTQVGVFSLWGTGLAAGRVSVRNLYVHSKVAVADDRWATVGTANLDGISLQSSEELANAGAVVGAVAGGVAGLALFGALVPPVLLAGAIGSMVATKQSGTRRMVEINAMILDGIDGHPATGTARQLREALWTEHLGTAPGSRPPGGWLQRWRDLAAQNIALLSGSQWSPRMIGRILPYRPEAKARDQLTAMGVNTSRLTVLD